MKKPFLFFFLLSLFMFIGCKTFIGFSGNPLDLKAEGYDEFLQAIQDYVGFDPYADKIYFKDEKALTDAYKRYIITLLNADSGGPLPYYYHYAGFSSDGYNHGLGKLTYGRDAVDPETFSKDPFLNIYKAYFYDRDNFGWDGWNLYPNLSPDQIPKEAKRRNYSITKNFENWLYNKDELEDVLKHFYTHGWAVFKTGPAVTEEGFQFYRIPLRVVTAVFTTPKHTHFDQPADFNKDVLGQIIYDFEDLFYTDTSSRVPQAPPTATPPPASAPGEKSAAEKLEELKGLFEAGLITEEEYKAKREEILSAL